MLGYAQGNAVGRLMRIYGIPFREKGYWVAGERNPVHKAVAKPEYHRKLSQAGKRKFQRGYRQWNTGKRLTAEHRQKITDGLLDHYKDRPGPLANRRGRRGVTFSRVPPPEASRGHMTTEPLNGKQFHVRSMPEAVFAGACLSNNIDLEYEAKTIDLGDMTYTPDFYLPAMDVHVEVKNFPSKYWLAKAIKAAELIRLAVLSELDAYMICILFGGHRALGSDETLPENMRRFLQPLTAAYLGEFLQARFFGPETVGRLTNDARELRRAIR